LYWNKRPTTDCTARRGEIGEEKEERRRRRR
jgi:hypothetical protein